MICGTYVILLTHKSSFCKGGMVDVVHCVGDFVNEMPEELCMSPHLHTHTQVKETSHGYSVQQHV